jgi:hypothetical protein
MAGACCAAAAVKLERRPAIIVPGVGSSEHARRTPARMGAIHR